MEISNRTLLVITRFCCPILASKLASECPLSSRAKQLSVTEMCEVSHLTCRPFISARSYLAAVTASYLLANTCWVQDTTICAASVSSVAINILCCVSVSEASIRSCSSSRAGNDPPQSLEVSLSWKKSPNTRYVLSPGFVEIGYYHFHI